MASAFVFTTGSGEGPLQFKAARLFQDITVSISYGRTGRGGQEIRYGGMPSLGLQSIVHDRLHRRLSANHRIGCRYKLTELEAASGFDRTAWLPSSILAGFVD